MRFVLFLILMLSVLLSSRPLSAFEEQIISKKDADHIFSLTKPAWEIYVRRIEYPPNWKSSLSSHDTGTGIIAFDTKTGYGLSIQPLYSNEKSVPDMLVVGNYYPKGTFPDFTKRIKKDIEEAAKKDLGPKYSVNVTRTQLPKFDGIELIVTKVSK